MRGSIDQPWRATNGRIRIVFFKKKTKNHQPSPSPRESPRGSVRRRYGSCDVLFFLTVGSCSPDDCTYSMYLRVHTVHTLPARMPKYVLLKDTHSNINFSNQTIVRVDPRSLHPYVLKPLFHHEIHQACDLGCRGPECGGFCRA